MLHIILDNPGRVRVLASARPPSMHPALGFTPLGSVVVVQGTGNSGRASAETLHFKYCTFLNCVFIDLVVPFTYQKPSK